MPPGEPRFIASAIKGTYIVFVPWAKLPLGTVTRRGREWEAFTRLGRGLGRRDSRAKAATALASWTWTRMPRPAQRHAVKSMRRIAA